MTTAMLAPAVHVCAFALGCALIHAARAHAGTVTRLLTAAAVVVGIVVLIAASLIYALDDRPGSDEAAEYAVLANQ